MSNKIFILFLPDPVQRALPFPPLGISVLAGYLKRAGIAVQIDDLETKYWNEDAINIEPIKTILKRVNNKYNNPKKIFFCRRIVDDYLLNDIPDRRITNILVEWEKLLSGKIEEFDYIGFSAMSEWQLVVSICFAKFIKGKYNKKIVIGGSFITEKLSGLLRKYQFLDYFIIAEGEIPLLRLLKGEDPREIDNLIYKNNGEVVVNNVTCRYAENMSPDFQGLPFYEYKKNKVVPIPYETSKGCRNKCAFCITRRKSLFFKDPDDIIKDLKNIKENVDSNNFFFVDNAINLSEDFSEQLCQKIIKEDLNINWAAYCIPDTVDAEYFKLLRQSGCILLRWGVESLGDVAKEKMNKKIERNTVSLALRNSSACGIWNHLLFIVGYPGETPTDIIKVITFIVSHRKYFKSASVSPFDLGRIDLFNEISDLEKEFNIKDRVFKKDMLGIGYKEYFDRFLVLKRFILYFVLRLCGIKFTHHFNFQKVNFEKNQYIYRAFYEEQKSQAKVNQ